MIVVTATLVRASDGKAVPLGSMVIANRGGDEQLGDYSVGLLSKGKHALSPERDYHRRGKVCAHPRKSQSIWRLVWKALEAVGHSGMGNSTAERLP
jgi:hypothetical protein